MVIITDANGNIQSPTIPENVYQGSNLANEIIFLAPLAQSNIATITFRLPNGELLEERPMTPYTSVPSEYNLSGWRVSLDDVVTQYYGQVTFQIYVYGASGNIWYLNDEPVVTESMLKTIDFKSKGETFGLIQTNGTQLKYGNVVVYDGSNWADFGYREISFEEIPTGTLLTWLRANAVAPQPTIITSVAGTFPVLRGVPRIPHSQPSQASWQQVLTWISTINASLTDIENIIDTNWLESKGILPYDSTFSYQLGASVFDKATKAIYTSLIDENFDNSLSDTTVWGKTMVSGVPQEDVQQMIDDHNTSATAHQDIRSLISANTNDITAINEKIPTEASSSNKLADKKWVTDNYVPITFASRLYLSKTSSSTADLVNTAPTPSATNTLVVTSTNTSFDWSSPTITVTRTLESAIQLNNTNSFAVDLYFDLSRNTELTFGAKIKVSTDNGSTWSYISSNQSFGEKSYSSGFNTEDIVVYTDLATNITYPVGTLVAIELFKKQEHNSSLTTTYYCGVEIDGANVYSFVEFNFANTRINTNQIEDGAVTYDKLSQGVKDILADPYPAHTGADLGKVLTVDSNNDVVWDYPADEFVTFTKTNSSGTLTVTSDDWVKAMNNDKAILLVTDNTDYYVLYKVKYDASTVYFEGDGKVAQFIKNGVTYSGTFASAGIEYTSNKVISISSLSTDDEYPSAKCVYDLVSGLSIIFTNTAVSTWVADNTYADYGYKATLTLTGVTADMVPQVIFGATEATSGNYLPIAESYAGGIYIYSKVNDAITIPTIIVQKAV